MIDKKKVRRVAEERHKKYKQKSGGYYREFSEDQEYIGLLGEATFADEFNLEVDWSIYETGDKGIDFYTPNATIDVKTYRKPYNLLIEVGRGIHADIYVLVAYLEEIDECKLIGWQWGSNVRYCKTKDFGYGVMNYYCPASDLYPMDHLHDALKLTKPYQP